MLHPFSFSFFRLVLPSLLPLSFSISSYFTTVYLWNPLPSLAMSYRNCAPPPSGVNFQPPVPDTTFGTISHIHVPRFDGGAHQVGASYPPMFFHPPQQLVHFQMPCFPAPAPTCTTVLVPKTFYVNDYPYYASRYCFLRLPAQCLTVLAAFVSTFFLESC